MRGLVDAPTPAAALAFLDLLDLEKDQRARAERLAKLAPLRLAGSLNFSGARRRRGRSLRRWHCRRRSPDGAGPPCRRAGELARRADRHHARHSTRRELRSCSRPRRAGQASQLRYASVPPKPGRVVLKAAGTPANGMLSLLQITSDDFSADYNGRLTIPATGPTDFAGTVAVTARDARAALAIAGLRTR